MMRIAPAAKAFVFAKQSFTSQRTTNVAFTALRMMSSAAPAVKVSSQRILGAVFSLCRIEHYARYSRSTDARSWSYFGYPDDPVDVSRNRELEETH